MENELKEIGNKIKHLVIDGSVQKYLKLKKISPDDLREICLSIINLSNQEIQEASVKSVADLDLEEIKTHKNLIARLIGLEHIKRKRQGNFIEGYNKEEGSAYLDSLLPKKEEKRNSWFAEID